MTPRWLGDLVRLYAICVGCMTLFSIGVVFYAIGSRNQLHATLVLDRAVIIVVLGTPLLFVIGAALYVGCHWIKQKPPILLVRCWLFVLYLSIFTVLFAPALQMARE